MSGGPRFRYYKAGFSRQISPVNLAGWIALGIWLAVLILLIFGITGSLRNFADPLYRASGAVACAICSLMWLIGGIVWMRSRSEIVDADELYEEKQKRSNERKR